MTTSDTRYPACQADCMSPAWPAVRFHSGVRSGIAAEYAVNISAKLMRLAHNSVSHAVSRPVAMSADAANAYLPVKRGARFSLNAATPSL